jgi:lysyl-tRNA synthetase class 2
MTKLSPWWSPHVHADRRPLLSARTRIIAALRAWFAREDFVEVETSCLQVSPGNETHLNAFRTELVGTDLARTTLYLRTSPEFAMKKLLAAGETRVFTIGPVFRNRERGPLHHPEFTMLEWYRANAPYEALWQDCAAIVRIAAQATGRNAWEYRGRTCQVTSPYAALSVDQAFSQLAQVPLSETYGPGGGNRDALAKLAASAGFRIAADDTWSDIFSRVLVERIEPELGSIRPTILHAYPAEEAALARRSPEEPRVAERFELYVCGVELANGFGELRDAAEQRHRLEGQMAERQRRYGERYPIDEEFLAALAAMPEASGCALGLDRLVMLATGAARIDDVIWTPLG